MTDRPLSSRERVSQSISGGFVDRIPKGELCITDDVISRTGSTVVHFEERVAFVRNLGLDLVTLSPDYLEGGHKMPSLSHTVWPDLDHWRLQTPLFLFVILDGAFEWGLRVFQPTDFLIRLVKDPDSLLGFIYQIEDFNLSMVERLVSHGIDGVILADDIATQNSLYVRPQVLRNLFIPSLSRQVEGVLSRNIPVFFHSDGNYLPVIEDIIDTGLTGLQCLEKRASMNVEEIQKQFGHKICLWGHLDVEDIDRAEDLTERANLIKSIHALSAHGRLILGTTSGIFSGINIHFLKEIYDTV